MKISSISFLLSIGLFVLFFKPAVSFGDTSSSQSLVGSSWVGSGNSGSSWVSLTHVLHFNSDSLIIESICSDGVISSTLKSKLAITYINDTTAKLTSGLVSQVPTGRGTCSVNIPASLEFHVEAELMSIGFDGSYQPTQMKRQN